MLKTVLRANTPLLMDIFAFKAALIISIYQEQVLNASSNARITISFQVIRLDVFQIVIINEFPTVNSLVFKSVQVITLLHQMVIIVSYFVRVDNLFH